MAEFIARDLGAPFDPVNNPMEAQEFQDFSCPPNTTQIVADLQDPLAVNSRAHRLFDQAALGNRLPLTPDIMPTPDPVVPNVTFSRQGMNRFDIPVPGLGNVEVWSFRDDTGDALWPGPTIRIREGQVAHTLMTASRGQHTIHHHGIEPTPANDGVGHLTFDVGADVGLYNYQWQAAEAGTYFYHCHVNTVLHFEMGMYGMLIIDPPEGPGFAHVGNTPTSYQREAIWVTDDLERRWHAGVDGGGATHGTGSIDTGVLCDRFALIGETDNPRFHDFNPDVFVISGQLPTTRIEGLFRHPIPGANVTVARGERVLVRLLNAAYTTTHYRFPTSLQGQVIAKDGRTLGREPFGRYSRPFTLASINHQFALTTAQRWDILIDTTVATIGQHVVEIDFHHWITDQIFPFGRLSVAIIVE